MRPLRTAFRGSGRFLAVSALSAVVLAATPAHGAENPAPVNAGFESHSTMTTGWEVSGHSAAARTEAGGHRSNRHLTHSAPRDYTVNTVQRLTGLADGNYTLGAWVRSSGGQDAAYIGLRDCGGPEERTALPATPNGRWLRIVVSTRVTGGSCTLALHSDAKAGQWAHFDDLTFRPGAVALEVKGGDLSSVPKNEDNGATYRDAGGTEGDPVATLGSAGMNYARLKVWVDPADGYNTKDDVLAMAKRVKEQGMKLLVDFHYSDFWADPGRQDKPAAWADHGHQTLMKDVYDHTYDVLDALKNQGTTADMVQIGNELNSGMLWPEGHTDNWPQLAQLLTSGANAVKDVSSSTQVALHLAEGGDNEVSRWWFDEAVAHQVPFDVIALSYYSYWHGPLSDLQANLDDVATRYGKPVLVAETAYPHTLEGSDDEANNVGTPDQLTDGYPATPAGQTNNLRDVMNIVAAVPDGLGLGVVYWEPAWTAVEGGGWDPTDPSSGNPWENQALFNYDNTALPALELFGQG